MMAPSTVAIRQKIIRLGSGGRTRALDLFGGCDGWSKRSSSTRLRRLLVGTTALLLVAGVITAFQHRLDAPHLLQKSSAGGRQVPQSTFAVAGDNTEAERFLAQYARPALQATAQKNQEAIARARDHLGKLIDEHRAGIEPFIADLRSWTAEYHILINLAGGWWYQDERLADYIDGKLRQHLFTEDTIASDVANVLVELREDIEANGNQLLVNLRNDLTSSNLAAPPGWSNIDAFSKAVSARVSGRLGSSAQDSIALNTFASMSVDLAATTIVPAIVGQAAKAATMSAGGMVVGKFGGIALEIGGGTAAGSEVPIIGNAVGLFVGVVVAVLAQDFGEAVENEMLRRDLNRYIDDLKVALVGDGSMQSELTKNMDAYVRKNDQAQAEIVEEPIFGSRKDQQP